MQEKNYYRLELNKLSSEGIQIKLTSQEGDTRRMNLNQDSADALIEYLIHWKADNIQE